MKQRHEIIATHELSRKTNDIVNTIDMIITYLLANRSPEDATPIYATLAELKADIVARGVSLKGIKSKIATYITKRGVTFDISQYIDSNLIALNTKLADCESLLTKVSTDISKAGNNTFEKIAAYAQTLTNPMSNVSAVAYDTDTKYVNIINDLLDAASYSLHGVNPDNGTALGETDEQIKIRVRGYLIQVPRFKRDSFTPELLTDYNQMKAVADYVLANLEIIPLNDLGTYIDSNVEKLPLMRRNWA